MVFSTPIFLFVFFPVFFVAYFLVPDRWKNLCLLCASLVFYAWGEPVFVAIMVASIVFNHFIGLRISARHGRWFLVFGVLCNVGLLVIFKYLDLLVSGFNALIGSNFLLPGLPLPIGISFFTFQSLSYLIDISRKVHKPSSSLLKTAVYISMFPQLIAGPIVRYIMVEKQLHKRVLTPERVWDGIKIFMIGFTQKVLLANTLATPVDFIFALDANALTASLAWLGATSYTLQIYFDFQGYSNMAIGIGLMLGFNFPKNFNYPYISGSIMEFWRRWHITLSSWFRDYVYIPLGGNRKGPVRTYINLGIVFILTGLWHGAAWTFLAWGMWHGFFLIIERLFLYRKLAKLPLIIGQLYAILAVLFGWVLFRSETFEQSGYYYLAMLGLGDADPLRVPYQLILKNDVMLALIVGAVLATPLLNKSRPFETKTAYQLLLGVLFLVSIASITAGNYNPFLYFRF